MDDELISSGQGPPLLESLPGCPREVRGSSSILLRASGQLSAWHTPHCIVMISLSFFTHLTEYSWRADAVLWAPQALPRGLTGIPHTMSDGQAGPVRGEGLLAPHCGSWRLSYHSRRRLSAAAPPQSTRQQPATRWPWSSPSLPLKE